MATNPCTATMLASRLPAGAGLAELHAWIALQRAALLAHQHVNVAGLGRFAVLGEPRTPRYSPNLALLEQVNGTNVVAADRDPVVSTIVAALLGGHDAVELPGLGTLHVRRASRACIEFDFDDALISAIR